MVIFVDKFRDESIDDYRSIVTLPRSTMIRMRIRDINTVLLRRSRSSGVEGGSDMVCISLADNGIPTPTLTHTPPTPSSSLSSS